MDFIGILKLYLHAVSTCLSSLLLDFKIFFQYFESDVTCENDPPLVSIYNTNIARSSFKVVFRK